MATNEFQTFAEGGNPSISSYDEWEDDAARVNGFTSGVAKSKPVNRVLKQGAAVSKAIADIIVEKTGKDALLNSASLQEGIEAVLAQYLPLTGGTVTGDITAPTFTGTASYATKAGTADRATTATSATSATKATQDSSGQTITSTYIKSASVSGTTVTFTRGNGTTFTITTQDTNTVYTLPAASTSAYGGLKPSSSWARLVSGTATTTYSYTATQNCFLVAYNTGGTNSATSTLSVGGTTIYSRYTHHNNGKIAYPMIYLAKGQTATYTQESCYFVCSILYMG
jgi:hypothetical protein